MSRKLNLPSGKAAYEAHLVQLSTAIGMPRIEKSFESYDLARIRSTPFPNRLLERSIILPETQARLLLLIVRSTLGWYGGHPGKRRASEYFSYGYLMNRVGRSTRDAVTHALGSLADIGLVEALDDAGVPVRMSAATKPYRRGLRLRIAPEWVEEAEAVDNVGMAAVNRYESASRTRTFGIDSQVASKK